MHEPARVAIIEDDSRQLELLTMISARQRASWSIVPLLADGQRLQQLFAEPASMLGEMDLLLVDSHLGDRSACDILPELAAIAPVVLLCGNPGSVDRQTCLAAGAQAVAAKPYDLVDAEEMLAICDRILSTSDDHG